MLTEDSVRAKIIRVCHLAGIAEDEIEITMYEDFEAFRPGQWSVSSYLWFAMYEEEQPRVHAYFHESLLRHSRSFCKACVYSAMAAFLDESNEYNEYLDKWTPYHAIRGLIEFENPVRYLMVFPKGSIIKYCNCGESIAYSPAEVAFGRAVGVLSECSTCGADACIGMLDGYVLTSYSGLYLETKRGIVELDRQRFSEHCDLDLSSLARAGLVDDARNIGRAMYRAAGGLSFEESWAFLYNHPRFEGHFPKCFEFNKVMVSRETAHVEDDEMFNTCPQVWAEGGWMTVEELADWLEEMPTPCKVHEGVLCHDLDIDTGGWTFEEAVCNLAMVVKYYYGDGKGE